MYKLWQWCCGYKERNNLETKSYIYPNDLLTNHSSITSFEEIPDILLEKVEYCETCKKNLNKADCTTKCGSHIYHFCSNKCYNKWLKPNTYIIKNPMLDLPKHRRVY